MDGRNNFPKLHNAMWPGLVGKGPDSEPPIGLSEMLDLTAAAGIENAKFDGSTSSSPIRPRASTLRATI